MLCVKKYKFLFSSVNSIMYMMEKIMSRNILKISLFYQVCLKL
jgi:hypothetical protein